MTTARARGAPCVIDATESEVSIALSGREPVVAPAYGVPQRAPKVERPVVLHMHGGNFTCGGIDKGRSVAQALASAGATVVSLAYPLAPMHPFPDAIMLGYEVLEWLYTHRTKLGGKNARVYLAGEEAGGNLAASLAQIARDRAHPPLAGQILLSPMLDPCAGTASLRQVAGDAGCCKYTEGWQKYLRLPRDVEHPYAVPASSRRLANLAPALFLVRKNDAMHDEAKSYADRLQAAGVTVRRGFRTQVRGAPDAISSSIDPAFETKNECSEFREFFEATQEIRRSPDLP